MTRRRRPNAEWVSLVLNPSFLTGIFFVVLAWHFEPSGRARWVAAGVAASFATLVPIAALFVLVAAGRLSDVEMRQREERGAVYLTCLISYVLGTLLLVAVGTSWPIWGFMALHVPNTLVVMLLNRRWKVSVHTTVISGLCAAGVIFFGPVAWPALGLLVLAAWARWASGAHTVRELVSGALLGAVSVPLGLAGLRLLVGT